MWVCHLEVNKVVVQLSNIVNHNIVFVKKKFNWSKPFDSEKKLIKPVNGISLFIAFMNVILKIIVLTAVSGSCIV